MPEPVDLSRVRTIPLTVRANKVSHTKFARPPRASDPSTWLASTATNRRLPCTSAVRAYRTVADPTTRTRAIQSLRAHPPTGQS